MLEFLCGRIYHKVANVRAQAYVTPTAYQWYFILCFLFHTQESTEEVSSGLPFLADLALGLSVLGCTMLHLLYHGPEKSKEEISCEHLLKSKLLQRYNLKEILKFFHMINTGVKIILNFVTTVLFQNRCVSYI